jgi:hypothetical protein
MQKTIHGSEAVRNALAHVLLARMRIRGEGCGLFSRMSGVRLQDPGARASQKAVLLKKVLFGG